MNRPRGSALIVPVEAARALVAPWLGLLPEAMRALPPHIAALSPFLPADALDEVLDRELEALLAGVPAFDFSLARVARLADAAVLVPEPADPFTALTRLLWDEWPECPPFGGAYDDVTPRLTVAFDPAPADRAAMEAALAPALPLAARAVEVLLVEEDEMGFILERRRFTLGGRGV
jgi:hypothetical protein